MTIVIGWRSPGPPHSKYCCWQSVCLLGKRKQSCWAPGTRSCWWKPAARERSWGKMQCGYVELLGYFSAAAVTFKMVRVSYGNRRTKPWVRVCDSDLWWQSDCPYACNGMLVHLSASGSYVRQVVGVIPDSSLYILPSNTLGLTCSTRWESSHFPFLQSKATMPPLSLSRYVWYFLTHC